MYLYLYLLIYIIILIINIILVFINKDILVEDLWNIKSENYPKKSLVTAVTSFSSLFIIFGYGNFYFSRIIIQ